MCGKKGRHCFDLELRGEVVVWCHVCETENALDVTNAPDGPCRNCGAVVKYPLESDEEAQVCYQCLRAGHAALRKDTVLGMVCWDEANAGLTYGLPGLSDPDFEMIPVKDDEEEWTQARVPRELLFELVRSPNYDTWQGEKWQFCCRRPMIYVGKWGQQDFESHDPNGDGRALFLSIVDGAHDGLWNDSERSYEVGTYVFRCPVCGKKKAHWDWD
ncbi:MAG: CbrC family protein [Chloroflexia bacterium]